MRTTIAAFLIGVLLVGTVGCGSSSGKASIKAGDPATKNTVDPPDATKFPGKRK